MMEDKNEHNIKKQKPCLWYHTYLRFFIGYIGSFFYEQRFLQRTDRRSKALLDDSGTVLFYGLRSPVSYSYRVSDVQQKAWKRVLRKNNKNTFCLRLRKYFVYTF